MSYACLEQCLNSVFNVKALVGALNQEKALVGAFSVIVKPMDRFTALLLTRHMELPSQLETEHRSQHRMSQLRSSTPHSHC